MGVINLANTTNFISPESLIARIKEDLRSYDDLGLIDQQKFYKDIKYILSQLGVGVAKETSAVLSVVNFKTKLPDNFKILHAAYKCSPVFSGKDKVYPQTGFVYYLERTDEKVLYDNCEIQTTQSGTIIDKITVRTYLKGQEQSVNFKNPVLLKLSANVKTSFCTENCLNHNVSSPNEITIDNNYIWCNFTDDNIYMKYYGFAVDSNNLPLIPNIESIEKTIEYFLKFRIFENIWINDEHPDVEKRMLVMEKKYKESRVDAEYEIKLPSFASLANMINNNKHRFDNYQLIRF